MADAPKLLPCPFCGGEAEMRQIGNEHTKQRGFDTQCGNRACRFGRKDRVVSYSLEWLRPRVIAAWNTRAGFCRAASEMYEALELALPFVRNDNAASVIRAALAKARGES